MRLTIKRKDGQVKAWVAKTARGFNKTQLKEQAEWREKELEQVKTFSDLEFEPHIIARKKGESGAEIAKLKFPNGTGISVIRGSSRFQSGPGTYEVATQRNLGRLEIHPFQTSAEITQIMKELQK